MPRDCLNEGTVIAFLDGELPAVERTDVEGHLETCSSCSEWMTWAAAEEAHRSRLPGEEGLPFIGTLAPGSRVDRYQVLGAVGRGGMGQVYAAYHPDLDRRIALKVVHATGTHGEDRRGRLLREARAIARLSHPNVIAVYDAGSVDDGIYVAMEFVEGQTIDKWLRAAPRRWREIVDIFVAAGRGLAAAHAAGVIHRDFKPQNVLVGRDGQVRVADFGLARMGIEVLETPRATGDPGPSSGDADGSRPPVHVHGALTALTRTGAVLGTPAYMAPEQFRGAAVDARADQFSFCVALHEALYGKRPTLAHLKNAPALGADDSKSARLSGAPAWLRTVVMRGLAVDREQRFPSMDSLLRALERGRTRLGRRLLAAAAGAAVAVVVFGGWRLAHSGHVTCVVPESRLAAAWSGQPDARRESIQRAFMASGRASAAVAWQRVSGVLDGYIKGWSAMFTEACEATNVRGEQSGEVLDLRMSCLREELDKVRALTDLLVSANAETVGHAVSATQQLAPLSRCADVGVLRSAARPLPRDERSLAAVRALQPQIRDLRALVDLGNLRAATKRGVALRPQVEAVGYRPLLAELLEIIGVGMAGFEPKQAEPILETAFLAAEASGDDETAVKAATHLVYVLGGVLGRHQEAERWAHISEALLDRLGGHERLRGWLLTDYAGSLNEQGRLEEALALAEKAIVLKEQALGKHHPDVANTLIGQSVILTSLGRSREGLEAIDRALDIVTRHGDPDGWILSHIYVNRGDALTALRRYPEAERDYREALRLIGADAESPPTDRAECLLGLGEAKLAEGDAPAAVPLLEEAAAIRERGDGDPARTATTRFALARAIWESGDRRARARTLAIAARDTFASHHQRDRETAVVAWLRSHEGAPSRR